MIKTQRMGVLLKPDNRVSETSLLKGPVNAHTCKAFGILGNEKHFLAGGAVRRTTPREVPRHCEMRSITI